MLAPQDCRGGGADRNAAGFSKLGHRHVAHDLNAAFAALRHQRLRQRGVGVLRQKHKFRRLIRQRAAKLFDPDHLFFGFQLLLNILQVSLLKILRVPFVYLFHQDLYLIYPY